MDFFFRATASNIVFLYLCYGFVILGFFSQVVLPGSVPPSVSVWVVLGFILQVVLPGTRTPCGVPVWFPRPSRDLWGSGLYYLPSPLYSLLFCILHFAFLLLQYALAIYINI